MGLLGLLFIVLALVTGALTYFLKGNMVWKSKADCTDKTVCAADDTNCCAAWDVVAGSIGYCRLGTKTTDSAGPACVPKSEVLSLSLAVATVALLFTGLVVLLIPGGSSEPANASTVALHLG